MATSTMGVKLDLESRERLKRLAKAKNRSSHWLIKEAVRRFLDAEERYEQERAEDQARYLAYTQTDVHITNEEMMTWLDQLAGEAAERGGR